jgi:hypothetical protein
LQQKKRVVSRDHSLGLGKDVDRLWSQAPFKLTFRYLKATVDH